MQNRYKTANLTLILNPLKRLQKILCEKSYQWISDRKMEFLTFITVLAFNFFWLIFLHFFNRLDFCIRFCILWYWYCIKNFLKNYHFLQTLKPNLEKRLKKTKMVFVLESHFTSISGLGGSILSKSQNCCTLLALCCLLEVFWQT